MHFLQQGTSGKGFSKEENWFGIVGASGLLIAGGVNNSQAGTRGTQLLRDLATAYPWHDGIDKQERDRLLFPAREFQRLLSVRFPPMPSRSAGFLLRGCLPGDILSTRQPKQARVGNRAGFEKWHNRVHSSRTSLREPYNGGSRRVHAVIGAQGERRRQLHPKQGNSGQPVQPATHAPCLGILGRFRYGN